ncbi:MAG: hypothetical protein ACLQO1_16950 [Steroidobacteraceae bacterium]
MTILKRPLPHNAADPAASEPRKIEIQSDDSAPVDITVQRDTRDVPPPPGSVTLH